MAVAALLDRTIEPAYSLMFLANRLLSVLLALATLVIVYALAREIRSRRAGVWAALVLLLTLPFSYYAKLSNVDVPYVFLFALSLVFYVRLLRNSLPADFYLFTLIGVLAVCVKDQAYGFYVLPGAWMGMRSIWSTLRRTPVPRGVPPLRVLMVMTAIAIVTFVIGQNVLFNPVGFREHVEFLRIGRVHYQMFPGTFAGQLQMLWTALIELGRTMSWPLALAGAFGVLAVVRRGPRELRWLLLPAVSFYLTCIGLVLYHYDRFFLGIIVVLAIITGVWIDEWMNGFRLRRALLAVAVVYALARVVSLDALLILDARYTAEQWLAVHVPAGRTIAGAGLTKYLPREEVVSWQPLEEDLGALGAYKPDYVVINVTHGTRDGDAARRDFYKHLMDGSAGYTRVAWFRTRLPFSPLNYEARFQALAEDPFSNLGKINPPIEVYARQR